jgi:Na+/H+ antiporter NhaD/arsenite permease-like protein
MLFLCALSGAISAFVENVAVVLLVAPVAISLADKLKISPVQLLTGIAICSNLQGTATMVGDPPSMILAGYMKMSFLDFFIYHGRPGIFFAVEIGAVASMFVLAWIFRKHREPTAVLAFESCRSHVPTAMLGLLVVGLSLAALPDPDFKWFAGSFTMALAAVAIAWFSLVAKWEPLGKVVKSFDWDTTFFLVGVFVVVGALSDSGWIDKLADCLSSTVGNNLCLAFTALVMLSVLVSGFVDNVPFLLTMIPVAQKMADNMQVPVPLLMFGLLIGACLGGNLTPIGASANVVTVGMLRKRGYLVSFRDFMSVGIPFTAAAVFAACLFVWLIWSR